MDIFLCIIEVLTGETMGTNWSDYQKAIFKYGEETEGSLLVQAVAGAGKTTTSIELSNYVEGSTIFLAFNKAIATELQHRDVNAKTFHGVCYGAIKNEFSSMVDGNKLNEIMKTSLSFEQKRMYGGSIRRLIGLAKQSGVGIFYGYEHFQKIWVDYDLDMSNNQGNLRDLFSLTELIFEKSITNVRKIDFDDMLYLTVKHDLKLKSYKNIFVDEAQDTNEIQRAIVRQMMKKKTRIFAFGDRNQSIYRFRGSNSNSMDLIKQEFKCEELPLSISYRCPKKVVEYAKNFSPYIEASDNAIDGEVINHVAGQWKPTDLQIDDYVLCRFTKPIINIAYTLLKASIPVQVLGRDIGKGLKVLIDKCRTPDNSIDSLIQSVKQYQFRELEKVDPENESKINSINDKVETLLSLCESLPENKRTVYELNDTIDILFEDKDKAVKLSTVHKSKGLEAKRIIWVNHHQCPPKWASHPEDQQQERNICYVAITRSMKELHLVQWEV